MKTFALALALIALAAQAQAAQQSCLAQVGHEAATVFVTDCRMTSMATNSPCNEANPCSKIIAEVVRMCSVDMPGKPDAKLCEKYRKLQTTYPLETAQR